MKITPQQIASLFQSRPAQVVFRVEDLAEMSGITPNLVNKTINNIKARSAEIIPDGIGLEGKGCRREWLRDEAIRVLQVLLNLSPKARNHVAGLQAA